MIQRMDRKVEETYMCQHRFCEAMSWLEELVKESNEFGVGRSYVGALATSLPPGPLLKLKVWNIWNIWNQVLRFSNKPPKESRQSR